MARKLEVKIIGDASSLQRALGKASNSSERFGSKMGSAFGLAAKGVAAGSAAMAAGMGFAVKSAIDFESSFAGVRKTVDGSAEELQTLGKGFLDLSRRIPVNVNALNEIGEAAGQLGIKRKSILRFTEVIAKLGVSSNLAGEEGAAMLARFANVTKMPQAKFDRLGATIVALGNAGASTEKEIAEMALRLGAAGSQVGMTQPQILGLANALSSLGVEAEAGGSAMSTTMITIAKSVATGGKELALFAQTAGMASDDFARAWEKDAAGTLIQFVEGLDKIKKSGGNVFKTLDDLGLGGIRVRDALLRSAGAGDLMRESLELGTKAWEDNLALNKEAERRFETTAAQLQLLKNNINALAIVAGSKLLPAFNKALIAVTGFASQIFTARGMRAKLNIVWEGTRSAATSLYRKLQEAVADINWQGLFSGISGIGAGIAQSMANVDWAATGAAIISGITSALQGANQVASALAATIMDAARAVDWTSLGKTMGPGLLTAVLTAVTLLFDPSFWAQNWELMVGVALVTMPGRVLKIGVGLGRLFGRFGKIAIDEMVIGFRTAFPAIDSAVTSLLVRVGATLGNLPGIVATQFRLVARAIGTLIGDWIRIAGAGAAQLVTAVLRALERLAPQVALAIRMAANAIRARVAEWYAAASRLAEAVIRAIEAVLERLPGAVTAKLRAAVAAVRSFVGAVFSAAASIGRALTDGVIAGIGDIGGRIYNAAAGGLKSAIGKLKGLAEIGSPSKLMAREIGRPLADGIVVGMDGGLALLYPKAQARIKAFTDKLKAQLDASRSRLETAFSGLSDKLFRAFDAETSGHRTAAEIELDTIAARRQAESLQRALDEARASGDPEAVARAEEDIRIAALEKQAASERKAYEDQRATMRENLEKRLTLLGEHFKKEGTTVSVALAAIARLMNKYGITFEEAGAYIGRSFMFGLQQAVGGAAAASAGVRGAQTGGNARPVPPIVTQVVLDGKVIAETVRKEDAIYQRANGVTAL